MNTQRTFESIEVLDESKLCDECKKCENKYSAYECETCEDFDGYKPKDC